MLYFKLPSSSRSLQLVSVVMKATTLLFFPLGIFVAHAAFDLNWARDEGGYVNNDAHVACDMSYISDNCGGFGTLNGSHVDGTAFFQQQFDNGGQTYFHLIVGDHTRDAFAQEVIIKANAGNNYWDNRSNNIAVSHTRANTSDQTFSMSQPYSSDSTRTGTGSGNPNSVIMRQVIDSGEIVQEFLKDSFTQKPKITQTITGAGAQAGMVSTVVIDMSGKNYSDLTPITAGSFTNTLTLSGALINGTSGNFNNSTDADSNYLTAGGFTYTTGSGTGGSAGNYTYMDAADDANPIFEPYNLNWQGYCKPSENPNWGNGACNGGGSGGGGGWGW